MSATCNKRCKCEECAARKKKARAAKRAAKGGGGRKKKAATQPVIIVNNPAPTALPTINVSGHPSLLPRSVATDTDGLRGDVVVPRGHSGRVVDAITTPTVPDTDVERRVRAPRRILPGGIIAPPGVAAAPSASVVSTASGDSALSEAGRFFRDIGRDHVPRDEAIRDVREMIRGTGHDLGRSVTDSEVVRVARRAYDRMRETAASEPSDHTTLVTHHSSGHSATPTAHRLAAEAHAPLPTVGDLLPRPVGARAFLS